MDNSRYTFDLIGFLLWWEEIVKSPRKPTLEEIDRINDSFYKINKNLNVQKNGYKISKEDSRIEKRNR